MERKPTYEELEQRVTELEKEEGFRDLVEGSIQGILIHRNWKPLFVNQAYAPKSTIKIVEILIISSLIRIVFNIKVQAKLLYSLIGKGFY